MYVHSSGKLFNKSHPHFLTSPDLCVCVRVCVFVLRRLDAHPVVRVF
jgi:hypothetical protein